MIRPGSWHRLRDGRIGKPIDGNPGRMIVLVLWDNGREDWIPCEALRGAVILSQC